MKRLRLLLTCLGVLSVMGFGQTPEQLFTEGNEAYQKGDFAKAAGLYESILHNGYANSDLYYNLGNVYYKQGTIARAILNYERAERLTPNDEDLRHNLQLANQMITDRIDPTPRLFVWDWWTSVKNWLSFEIVTWLLYVAFLLVAMSVSMVIAGRSYRMRRIALLGSMVTTVLLLFVGSVFAGRYTDAHRSDEAIVMSTVVNVKNSPDDRSSDAFVIHAGLKVQLIDRLGNWTKVRLADGKVGWLAEKEIEVI